MLAAQGAAVVIPGDREDYSIRLGEALLPSVKSGDCLNKASGSR